MESQSKLLEVIDSVDGILNSPGVVRMAEVRRQQAKLRDARVMIASAVDALRLVVAADGGTRYESEDDEIGCRACCYVLSYKDHESDCYVLKAKAALADMVATACNED